jgi:voltage-gated potassium channel
MGCWPADFPLLSAQGHHMEKTNFFYLLGALLVLLIAFPVAQDLEYQNMPAIKAAVFSVLLLVGIWSLKGGGRLYVAGMVFVIAGIALSVLAASLDSTLLRYGSLLAMFGFLIVAISYTLRQVVFGTALDLNRLVGAICVFLLLGMIWAFAYSLLDIAVPDSFKGLSTAHTPGFDTGWLYYSFVTLTTLGYGDITPATSIARTLSYMQAVAGQFYVAVLVAGLVSAFIADRQGR